MPEMAFAEVPAVGFTDQWCEIEEIYALKKKGIKKIPITYSFSNNIVIYTLI